MLAELRQYSKMAVGIAKLLRAPVPNAPAELLRQAFLTREQTFLELAKRVVFERPEHPYKVMFDLAGCQYGDLRNMVEHDGLNAALTKLRTAGVYLTHQEWKAREPIVRAGREIPRTPKSFANPFVTGWIKVNSSGSTGRPTSTSASIETNLHRWCYLQVRAKELDFASRMLVEVRPILPFPFGMSMYGARVGTPVDRWFSVGDASIWHYRTMTWGMLSMARALGVRSVYPEYLPQNDFLPVVRHIAQRKAEGRPCVMSGMVSPLVRVARTAIDHGIDIAGTYFIGGGEALTPGKQEVFRAAGSRGFASYGSNELDFVGMSCPALHGNDVHVLEDATAVIVYRRPSPYGDGADVDSMHFTTLAPFASLFFINIEMDDEAQLVPATCNCVFSRLGFTTLMTNIRSFGKLTPQGMTFHGAELQSVMEQELPKRLGGGPGDYQLVECEAANGQTQLRLHVTPRLGLTDAVHVRTVFVEIIRPRWGGSLATRWWEHSEGIEVSFTEPIATASGKVHPIRLLGAGRASAASQPR